MRSLPEIVKANEKSYPLTDEGTTQMLADVERRRHLSVAATYRDGKIRDRMVRFSETYEEAAAIADMSSPEQLAAERHAEMMAALETYQVQQLSLLREIEEHTAGAENALIRMCHIIENRS